MLRLRHAARRTDPTPAAARPDRKSAVVGRVAVAVALLSVVGSVLVAPAVSRVLASGTETAGPVASPAATSAVGSAAPSAPVSSGVGPVGAAHAAEPSATATSAPSATPSPTPTPPPSTGPAVLTPALSAALTKELGMLRAKYGIPGVQAAILFPDGHSWRAHAGFQDYGARVPVQNSTPFPIASVTKTFIAALVVELAQEGKFGLDDQLTSLLPGAGVDSRVTIRELLDHTSGIYDFFSNSKIDDAILGCRSCVWTPSKSLSFVKKPLFAPGTSWSYSNTGYVLLGELVERVTGQTYAQLLQTRFFGPLGLISTFVEGQQRAPYPVVHSYSFSTSSIHERPTSLWDGTGISPFRSLATAAGSAGDIASSARDLAVWARALYGGHVLGANGSTSMLDFAATTLLRASVPYGLGVEEFTMAGRLAYGHGGRLLGARSAIRYLPTEGVSIAVVINTDRGDPAVIADALANLALPPIVVPPPPPPPTPTPEPTATPLGTASPTPASL